MSKGTPQGLLIRVAQVLDSLDVDYFVTGGMAVSRWGRPRSTLDVNIVVDLLDTKVKTFSKLISKIGRDVYFDKNAVSRAVRKQTRFDMIDPDTGLKVDFIIKRDPVSRVRFQRKIEETIDGTDISFISPEDLILVKLDWYQRSQSSKHLEDADSVLSVSKSIVNKEYLSSQAERLGMSGGLEKII